MGCDEFSCKSSTDSGGCFSATSLVRVRVRGPVEMQHLQVGDQVLTGIAGTYQYKPIYAFGHLNKDVMASFYAITTNVSNIPLEITGNHLVYLDGKFNPVRADSLQVGDVLLSIKSPREITAIDRVEKHGLYNPYTANGRLIVNDLAVSTYVALQADREYYQVGLENYQIRLFSHQQYSHLYLSPFRMLCMGVSSQLCQVFDEDGIPYWLSYGDAFVRWLGKQGVLVQLFFVLVTAPFCLVLLVVELLVGSTLAPIVMFVVGLLANTVQMSIVRTKRIAA